MLRSIKRVSRWDRKSRINVESDLLFDKDSSQHVIAPFKPPFNFKNLDFAFSFFLQINSTANNDGTLFAIRGESENQKIESKIISGNLYFNFYRTATEYISMYAPDFITRFVDKKCHILIQRNGGTANNYTSSVYSIWINGSGQSLTYVNNTLGTDSHFNLGTTEAYLILGANLTTAFAVTNAMTGTIGNFCVLRNSFTEKQINYIHRNGGILPTISHATAVGHWPLTQKYEKTAYDVIEQYNYAKWILPQNFSGMAVFGSPSPWTLVSGTEYSYDRSINPTELQFTQTIVNSNDNTPRKIKVVFEITTAFDGDGIRWRGVVHDTFPYTSFYKDVGLYEFEVDLLDTHATVDATRVRCEPADNTNTGQINFISVTTRNTIDANHADLVNYTDLETGIPDPATNTAWRGFYDKTALDWIDSVDGDGDIIEKESGFQEIKKSLKTGDNGNQFLYRDIALDGLGESDYTLLFAFSMDENFFTSVDNSDLFLYCRGLTSSDNLVVYGAGSSRGFRVNLTQNSVAHTGQWDLQKSISLNRVNLFAVTFTVKNGQHYREHYLNGILLYVQNNWSTGPTKLDFSKFNSSSAETSFRLLDNPSSGTHSVKASNILFGLYSRILPQKEILEISNNALLKNPKIKTNLEMWVPYESVFDDGGVIKVKDLSPNGRHLNISGWSDINDYKANLTDINDLR